jgi:hypothetical protein
LNYWCWRNHHCWTGLDGTGEDLVQSM